MANQLMKNSSFGFTAMPFRWAFDLENWRPTKEEYELAICCVQPEEKKRIDAFYYSGDTKSSLVGRLLLRTAVAIGLGVPFDEIRMDRTEKGRPFIASRSHLKDNKLADLNISHQGCYCVLAAEAHSAVGIDVATTKYSGYLPLPEYFNLMERKFTRKEWDFICGPVPETERASRFFRLWALKESFVKAEGSGLGFELQRLSFRCPTARLSTQRIVFDTELYIDGAQTSEWRFEETMLDEDYCAAVAVHLALNKTKDEMPPKNFELIDFSSLRKFCKPLRKPVPEDWERFRKKETKQR